MNETATPLWAVALHESGHAVVAHHLGLVVERVSLEPVFDQHYGRWRSGTVEIEVVGDIARDFSPAMRQRLRAEAVALLAGQCAERHAASQKFRARNFSTLNESDTDLAHATWLLSRDVPREHLPRALRATRAAAERIVGQRWPAIAKLAERLIRSREITWRARHG